MRLLLHLSTKIKVHTILVRNICSISHYGSNNVIQQTSKFKTFFAITAFRPNNDGKLALFPIQRNYSDSPKPMSKVEKLKKVVKDYGTTVVIFHIAISLVSLGISYFLVSNGKIDMRALGFSESFADRMDSKTGVALMTLSLYKIFFPIRIIITLTCAPLLIKYLKN